MTLVSLKTALEIQALDTLIEFYIVRVPVQLANRTLNLVRAALPDDSRLDIQHLRRFAKVADLPAAVRERVGASKDDDGGGEEDAQERVLLVGSVNAIALHQLHGILSPSLGEIEIAVVPVPGVAPTSAEQAAGWSERYWPTVYRKTNAFGPHPSLYARAAEEIAEEAKAWMELAQRVGGEAERESRGEKVGVVVVERNGGVGRVLAVAGDARWVGFNRYSNAAGNISAHAVLRAIGMVSEGLRRKEEGAGQECETGIFQDLPLSHLERSYGDVERDGDGYLCHGLEIYCSHEPCVMCSMAIVHSRFAKLVFGKKMLRTGGICADGELGHGLFWRRELNWNLLAWQWVEEGGGNDVEDELNA